VTITFSFLSNRLRRRTWILLGIISLALLGVTFFVRVRIVVLQPDIGDISSLFSGFIQLLLFVATPFSGLMAYFSDGSDTGPATKIEVEGDYYDITFPSGEQPDTSDVPDAVPQSPTGVEPDSAGDGGSGEGQKSSESERNGHS
jgi:hypothetical protein